MYLFELALFEYMPRNEIVNTATFNHFSFVLFIATSVSLSNILYRYFCYKAVYVFLKSPEFCRNTH